MSSGSPGIGKLTGGRFDPGGRPKNDMTLREYLLSNPLVFLGYAESATSLVMTEPLALLERLTEEGSPKLDRKIKVRNVLEGPLMPGLCMIEQEHVFNPSAELTEKLLVMAAEGADIARARAAQLN